MWPDAGMGYEQVANDRNNVIDLRQEKIRKMM